MHRLPVLLLALAIVIALQGPIHWFNEPTSPERLIAGPDSFMRLQRVMDLHGTGAWYDPWQAHTNAPYGETLHWTRPMDALLYAGAWAGTLHTDFKTALVLWGAAISPLMMLGVVLIWSWATRDLLDDTAYLLSVAMLVLAPQLDAAFKLGRPDHHSLLMFLFFGQLAAFIRIAIGTAWQRHAIAAGALCGVALWVSIESLTHLLLFATALGVFWLRQGGPYLRTMAVYLVSLAAATVVALVLERPPSDWLLVQYDRISIVHVALTLAGAFGWGLIALADRGHRFSGHLNGRAAAAIAACAVPGLVMLAFFPKFFWGPFVDIASDDFKEWIGVISEYQSIVPVDRFSTGMFIAHLGPGLIALVYMLMRWSRAGMPEQRLLILMLLGLGLFFPLALHAIRWSMYEQAVVWLPWTLAIVALARRPWELTVKRTKLPVHAIATPLLLLGPIFAGMAIVPAKDAKAAKAACNWPAISEHLAAVRQREGVQLVFTHFFLGPEIVWRSGNRVVGAPYGNGGSLADTNKLFRAEEDETAREVVERRNADLILVCPRGAERRRYVGGSKDTFFVRLGNGAAPSWLSALHLPTHLADDFKLFQVIR